MKRFLALVLVLTGVMLIGATSNGTETEPTNEEQQQPIEQENEHVTETAMTPAEIGQAVSDLYVQSLQEVSAIAQEAPDAEAAKARLEQLKTEYIQKYVELGRKREALDEAGRSTVDSKIRMMFSTVSSDLFKQYQEAQKLYSGNKDVSDLIASFNVMTQYSIFDLLKKQLPEEAERLGIE
jgi:hypothetical protein